MNLSRTSTLHSFYSLKLPRLIGSSINKKFSRGAEGKQKIFLDLQYFALRHPRNLHMVSTAKLTRDVRHVSPEEIKPHGKRGKT